MYPGAHISRLYHDGMLMNSSDETEDQQSLEEETIAFWKSSTGRLRLAAGTTRRKGEVSVLLTESEAGNLGYKKN